MNSKTPFVYLIKRGSDEETLDRYLEKMALEAGVEIKYSCLAKDSEVDVIATGPKIEKAKIIAQGVVFDTDNKDVSSAIFDNSFSEKGYAYFFSCNGRATITTVCFSNFTKGMEYLNRSTDFFQKHYGVEMKNIKRFFGFGNFYLPKKDKRSVGEANGLQDYLWGFGMRYAMISGEAMARSIMEGRSYDNILRREIGDKLKTSMVNRMCFSWLRRPSYRMVMRVMKDPMKVFSWAYNPNPVSSFFYPLARICFWGIIKK